MSIRPVKTLIKSKPTMEGAGVHLRRAFGFGNTSDFDPFLLLDDFRNDVPEDYLAGFPWHPHRGIETITYVLAGTVEHGDSMGNRGAIAAGDVQWMTAGSGIIHQEMPKGDQAGRMHGFQLWANLPASLKMTRAALSGSEGAATFPRSPTTTARTCASSAETSGARPARWMASPPIRSISMSRCRRARARRCRSRPLATPSPTCSPAAGKFCNASGPLAVPTEGVGLGGHRAARRGRQSLAGAVRPRRRSRRCRPARTASAFCWSRESRSRSRWPGTARS